MYSCIAKLNVAKLRPTSVCAWTAIQSQPIGHVYSLMNK